MVRMEMTEVSKDDLPMTSLQAVDEKALEAALHAYANIGVEKSERMTAAITAYLAALTSGGEVKPVAWRYRYDGDPEGSWRYTAGSPPIGEMWVAEPLYASPVTAVPEGYVMVPREPTAEMVAAAHREQSGAINAGFAQAYRTMLASTPPVPEKGE